MKGESYFRSLDQLSGEHRAGLGVRAVPPPGQWDWYAQCSREDFVNCTFGTTGLCQNPRHAQGKGWGE